MKGRKKESKELQLSRSFGDFDAADEYPFEVEEKAKPSKKGKKLEHEPIVAVAAVVATESAQVGHERIAVVVTVARAWRDREKIEAAGTERTFNA